MIACAAHRSRCRLSGSNALPRSVSPLSLLVVAGESRLSAFCFSRRRAAQNGSSSAPTERTISAYELEEKGGGGEHCGPAPPTTVTCRARSCRRSPTEQSGSLQGSVRCSASAAQSTLKHEQACEAAVDPLDSASPLSPLRVQTPRRSQARASDLSASLCRSTPPDPTPLQSSRSSHNRG